MRTDKPAAWFRMYAEFANDPKVQMLSEVDQRRFIMLLCLRCSNGDVTLRETEVAFVLRVTEAEWLETKARLLDKGIITQDNKPTSWEKRQFESDSSAERVARHRAAKKNEGNNDVTLQKPSCNALETETEIEKKRISTPEQVGGAPPEPECTKPVNGSAISLSTFLDRCKAHNERPIGDYRPVWEYAEKVGVPEDAIVLAWQEFVRKYGPSGGRSAKRYRDWRQAFRNCVEENWLGLWTLDEQGRAVLTSKGRMAEKVVA